MFQTGGALDPRDADFVTRIPFAFAAFLREEMFAMLPPRRDGGFIAPVRHRDAEAVRAARAFDAEERFSVGVGTVEESSECIAGLVLQGLKKPFECPAFGTRCTPESPLGAPMVSSEGACAAYYLYGRRPHEGSKSELPSAAPGR